MPITIIVGWEVAIRDCEFKNFTKLVRGFSIKTTYSEQQRISKFLTLTGFNLTELVDLSDSNFQEIKRDVIQKTKEVIFFDVLEYCRKIIQVNARGSNLLRYLLYHMNNKIIKNQLGYSKNNRMSGLYVQYGCIPFDEMPFNTSPIGHNPRLTDLFACINFTERQHELFARLIKNNTEIKGQLFTSINNISNFDNIEELILRYNEKIYSKHIKSRRLVNEYNHVFINGYKENTNFVILKLKELAKYGVPNYLDSTMEWLNTSTHTIDCDEKKEALIRMFENSRVALIYGAAGTGKSTLINHISHVFADKKKLFLAQTNPAVDNLRHRVTSQKTTLPIFSTITKFLKNNSITTDYELLIIDECSTVSNSNMKDILSKSKFNLLVLVGDSYQIESIRFGNWFSIARKFIPQTSVFELTKPYRTNEDALLTLWSRVRKMEDTVLEIIAKQDYSSILDASIFTSTEKEEIILCLNYDGLYGINNINRFLQKNNTNVAVQWEIQQYKVNDPILFNESNRFSPIIFNNMKGWIMGIKILDREKPTERIQFDIELDKVISSVNITPLDLEFLESAENGNSVIRFCVNKLKSVDEDDDDSSKVEIPFQVAYAVSIHKAQGLEYDSVKIIITDEVEELITHNIFYTAITRARKKLKIYWTPEVEQKVLKNIKPQNIGKDVGLLKNYIE